MSELAPVNGDAPEVVSGEEAVPDEPEPEDDGTLVSVSEPGAGPEDVDKPDALVAPEDVMDPPLTLEPAPELEVPVSPPDVVVGELIGTLELNVTVTEMMEWLVLVI